MNVKLFWLESFFSILEKETGVGSRGEGVRLKNTPYLCAARDKFGITPWLEVYLVLEEDGTEVDEEEYFQVIRSTTNHKNCLNIFLFQ